MISALHDFHWLRPTWLFALIPLALLLIAAAYKRRNANQWDKIIPSDLLAPLIVDGGKQHNLKWITALGAAWLIATIAIAGPSWQKLPQPVHKSQQAMVVLLDLSPSMLAQDLKPSRLVRSRYKLTDLLKARQDGLTGLVAYAGDAHVVTPLTDDTATIISLLPALDPRTMPVAGSRVEDALTLGLQLMHDSGISEGQFLLITDGVAEDAQQAITDKLDGTPFTLSILAVGSQEGAPIPLPNGFAKSRNGDLIISKLNVPELQALAHNNRGRFTTLTADNRDIDFLLSFSAPGMAETQETERVFDTWRDNGAYLCLLLLPFAALAFRRGMLLSALFALGFFSIQPNPAFAQSDTSAQTLNTQPQIPAARQNKPLTSGSSSENTKNNENVTFNSWDKLWRTPDQRGEQLLEKGNPAAAAREFENPNWKASADYTAGNYAAAASSFKTDTATGNYNRGNALAQAGKLEEALQAYDKALQMRPNMEDAEYNKKIVEDLLKKQQEQKQDQQDQNQNQSGDDQQKNDQGNNQNKDNQQSDNEGDEQKSQDGQKGQDGQDGQNSNPENGQDSQQSDKSGDQENKGGQQSDNDQADLPDSESQTDKPSGPPDQPKQSPEQTQAEQGTGKADTEDSENNEADAQAAVSAEDDLTPEQAQALEQWLRQVPDDPSGLLRRKFDYEHRLKEREQQWQGPPAGETRW